ncbi:MAG TPA: helix-turn-helix domain-containing protein [Bacteroidia bacterium]|nr:helix-turn-helix domain-containing protein [Bacteroidia bacterium]
MNLNALLSFAVLVTGCIVTSIVFYKHKELSSRLFAFSLFSLNYAVLLIFLFESKYILYVPFFFRTAPLFYYLIVPSFYMYLVFVLKKRSRLHWTDSLHLLPAIIYFIDYIPLFLSTPEYKLQLINTLIAHDENTLLKFGEGWIMPARVHFLGPIIIGLVYLFFAAKLLLHYYRFSIEHNKKLGIFRWLVTAASLYLLLEISSLAIFLFALANQWLLTTICIMVIFFTISLILFSEPYLLYGRYFNATYSCNEIVKKHKQLHLAEEKINELQQLFESYIKQQHYLHQHTNLKQVASHLNTQPYVLSTFINQVYRMHFNDLINRHRIKYIEDGLTSKKWETLTLEAIAGKAGFNNRITFLAAFKKFTGTTPTQYIKKLSRAKNHRQSNTKV